MTKIYFKLKNILINNNCLKDRIENLVHMVCSMANRTGSGLHVSDLLEILRIDKLT